MKDGVLCLWIVEASWDKGPWHPTLGVALTRQDGRAELAGWKQHNPDDQFRLTKYVRETQLRCSQAR